MLDGSLQLFAHIIVIATGRIGQAHPVNTGIGNGWVTFYAQEFEPGSCTGGKAAGPVAVVETIGAGVGVAFVNACTTLPPTIIWYATTASRMVPISTRLNTIMNKREILLRGFTFIILYLPGPTRRGRLIAPTAD